jgi:DNA-binding MarR family transcriptional regulator
LAKLTLEDCAANRAPGRLLRRLEKDTRTFIEDRLVDADLSFVQWTSLKLVEDGAALTAGDLARDINITTGATTRLIDVLEARGLLARDRGSDDRRVVRLAITENGRAAMRAVSPLVVKGWNELVADFSQDELDLFTSLLRRLLIMTEAKLGKTNRYIDVEAAE